MTWGYVAYAFLVVPALVIGYVVFAVWQTRRAIRSGKSRLAKIATAAVLACVFVLLPTWDVVKGRATFDRLCDVEAGRKVHKTIELDEKHFDAYGSPQWELLRADGSSFNRVAGRYKRVWSTEDLHGWPRITRSAFTYIDEANGDLIAESVNFIYWGGWVYNSMPGHHTGESCEKMRTESIERFIFKPAAK